jgi:hypothetical protein
MTGGGIGPAREHRTRDGLRRLEQIGSRHGRPADAPPLSRWRGLLRRRMPSPFLLILLAAVAVAGLVGLGAVLIVLGRG